jgi:GntR family transcriptional regulator
MTEFDPNIPIYAQIMNAIKLDIVKGTLKSGSKLPSVREQAEALTVNPNTAQRAYQELEREGVCETRRGMGTFIVERSTLLMELKDEMARSVMGAFISGMRALGYADDAIVQALRGELRQGNGALKDKGDGK